MEYNPYYIEPLDKEKLASLDINLNEKLEFKERVLNVIEQIENKHFIIIETHAKPTGEYGFLHSCHILLNYNFYGMLVFSNEGYERDDSKLECVIPADYHYSRSQQLVRGIHKAIEIIPEINEKLNIINEKLNKS